jgi:hypothetical protein
MVPTFAAVIALQSFFFFKMYSPPQNYSGRYPANYLFPARVLLPTLMFIAGYKTAIPITEMNMLRGIFFQDLYLIHQNDRHCNNQDNWPHSFTQALSKIRKAFQLPPPAEMRYLYFLKGCKITMCAIPPMMIKGGLYRP